MILEIYAVVIRNSFAFLIRKRKDIFMTQMAHNIDESIVGLSMISYTEMQKIKESSFRRDPIKWAHRKVIVIAKMNSKLCFEVLK